jgi:hypothetical protein
MFERGENSSEERKPVAVSFPGGLARQFRVQYLAASGASWQLYAIFRRREQAEECLTRLRSGGISARVVRYQICAAA